MSDVEKWKVRPKLDLRPDAGCEHNPPRGIDPCLFIVPPTAVDQPVVSGSVGECLLLLPDGRKLDLYQVFLWGGYFFPIKTDLYVPDSIPLAFTRTCNFMDWWSGRNRNNLRHVYDPYLNWDRDPYTYLRWFLPDGVNLSYRRVSPGSGFADALYENATPFPMFGGSRINWNGWGWDLSLKEGTTFLLRAANQGRLEGIFDKDGNEVGLTRNAKGDVTEVTSPSGSWIRFSYEKGLMSRAINSLGNVVEYTFDYRHRLRKVKDSRGQTTEYAYDSFMHVRAVYSDGLSVLENAYDARAATGKVTDVSLPDGTSYHIDYIDFGLSEPGKSGNVDITDSGGKVTRVTLDAKPGENRPYYTVEKLARVSGHH